MRFLPCMIVLLIIPLHMLAQPECLVFGKGGGIAGTATLYKILDNGKVYKGSGRVNILFTQQGKIPKSEAKRLYHDIRNLPDTTFSYPGNVYYFVQVIGDSTVHEYTWGAREFDVPDTLGSLYESAMNKLASLRYKKIKKPFK
ncbi:MAG: hypothetical protein JW973_16635 [Bacteroidales bacterium]|nr:hypothetical protein [Bacteroidales bacterium]